jgi:hypothetical protein
VIGFTTQQLLLSDPSILPIQLNLCLLESLPQLGFRALAIFQLSAAAGDGGTSRDRAIRRLSKFDPARRSARPCVLRRLGEHLILRAISASLFVRYRTHAGFDLDQDIAHRR